MPLPGIWRGQSHSLSHFLFILTNTNVCAMSTGPWINRLMRWEGKETPSPVEERFQSHSGGPQAFLCHMCTVPGRKDSMVKVSTVYIHFYAHLLSFELTHCILLSHYLSLLHTSGPLGSESDTGCSAQVLQRHAVHGPVPLHLSDSGSRGRVPGGSNPPPRSHRQGSLS